MEYYMTSFNQSFVPPVEPNPLQKYFRQAKVYITLPSRGKWYSPEALDMPENGELPVYAMTAKDELTMKTPDALLNGQATVDVIQSCVPNIKNAWKMPSIDLDAVLIAIRIATYGENLDIETKIPGSGEEKKYSVDLRKILNKLVSVDFNHIISIEGIKINIRPLIYQEFTKSSLKTFEEQRLFKLVTDEKISEEEKLVKFNESFKKLTDLTIDTMAKSICSITTDDVEVTNPDHILEFVQKSDQKFFKQVLNHLEKEKKKFQIEPFTVETTEEDQQKGAPKRFEIPVTFDQSNFFA
jgi:hypothetical protein